MNYKSVTKNIFFKVFKTFHIWLTVNVCGFLEQSLYVPEPPWCVFLPSFSVFLSLFLHVSTCPCQDKPAKAGDWSAALTPVNHRCWTLLASHKTSYACFVLSVSSLISFHFLFFSLLPDHMIHSAMFMRGETTRVSFMKSVVLKLRGPAVPAEGTRPPYTLQPKMPILELSIKATLKQRDVTRLSVLVTGNTEMA